MSLARDPFSQTPEMLKDTPVSLDTKKCGMEAKSHWIETVF